jgi:hypothetical protein
MAKHKTKIAPMIYPVPFRGEHAKHIRKTRHEAPYFDGFTDAQLKLLEGPHSLTLMMDSTPVLIIGPWVLWANRAFIWSFISQDATAEHFGEMQSYARAFLDGLPHRRLEIAIDVDFLPGHQWVRSLGFELEAKLMRAFNADGRDCSLYSIIKEVPPHG